EDDGELLLGAAACCELVQAVTVRTSAATRPVVRIRSMFPDESTMIRYAPIPVDRIRHHALVSEIVRSEDYEEPALDWMFAQVQRLKAALAQCGVVDEAIQRSVCEIFFFGLAGEFDD